MNLVLEDQGCGDLPGVVVSPVESGHQQHGEQTRNLVSTERLGPGFDSEVLEYMVDVEVMLNRHLSHQSLAHQLLVYDAGQSSTDESQERSVAYRHLQLRVKPDVLSAKLLEEQCESIYDFSLFVVYLFLEAPNISRQKHNICEPARAFITPMLIDGFRYVP